MDFILAVGHHCLLTDICLTISGVDVFVIVRPVCVRGSHFPMLLHGLRRHNRRQATILLIHVPD